MKKWLKASMSSLLIVVSIFLVLGIAYSGYISGPSRAYEREDRYIVEAMMKAKGYKQAQLLNRFSYDKVYYIAEVNHNDETFVVWFTKNLSKFVKEDAVDFKPMESIASANNMDLSNVNLGVYHDELVYVLKDKNYEAFYTMDTLDKVFEFGGDR